ncbi:MAG: hypothetical protein JWO57_3783 [Pseudonocardiales bacterium]|nr:hypothetical protein [Pseudonocardiales bacterium]
MYGVVTPIDLVQARVIARLHKIALRTHNEPDMPSRIARVACSVSFGEAPHGGHVRFAWSKCFGVHSHPLGQLTRRARHADCVDHLVRDGIDQRVDVITADG